jgi:energy-coupling factor transport system substrate-specific component
MEMHLRLSIQKQSKGLSARDITIMALMVAIIEVSKVALAQVPNVELTSFWVIMFTLYFGTRIFYVIPVFILIEGMMYGFNLWWIMYLYAWPLLAVVVLLLRKMNTAWDWSFVSGLFGLLFGFLCAIPYIFTSGLAGAVAWWVAGIPWDLVHGIANFIIMLVLYKPMKLVMAKMQNMSVEN